MLFRIRPLTVPGLGYNEPDVRIMDFEHLTTHGHSNLVTCYSYRGRDPYPNAEYVYASDEFNVKDFGYDLCLTNRTAEQFYTVDQIAQIRANLANSLAFMHPTTYSMFRGAGEPRMHISLEVKTSRDSLAFPQSYHDRGSFPTQLLPFPTTTYYAKIYAISAFIQHGVEGNIHHAQTLFVGQLDMSSYLRFIPLLTAQRVIEQDGSTGSNYYNWNLEYIDNDLTAGDIFMVNELYVLFHALLPLFILRDDQ